MRASNGNQRLYITSGYRSPYVQNIINPGVTNDAHVYGQGADILTGPNGTNGTQANWDSMRVAAKAANACVEPWEEQGPKNLYHYIHVQWTGAACFHPDSAGNDW
jgi:hypothetical protein